MTDPQATALAAMRAGRLDEAERGYRELLARHGHPAFLNNLALVLVRQRREAEAIPLLEQAIAARPADPGARVALANALLQCDRAAEALACCEAAAAIDPGHRDLLHNRAIALRELTRNGEAADVLQALLAGDPGDADAELNLALAELMLGRHAAGWRHYEARWRGVAGQRPLPELPVPAWRPGEPLRGRAVLLQAEQGLGDTIQFLRFVPVAVEACGRVEVQLPQSLLSLARRAFPKVSFALPGTVPRDAFDCRLGLLSLPLALGLEDPGSAGAYLVADASRVETWRDRLPPGRKVAIAWRGSPALRKDRQRSIDVQRLEPWFEAAGARGHCVIAMQRDLRDDERAWLARFPHVVAPGERLRDFDDSAACLALAGHVASVDTAVAHLAGALGRPATVLLHFASEWRWGIDRPPGSTYRSVRTLRQRTPGDWKPVVRELTESLP